MSSVQTWDPALYARNARFVSDLGSGVLELLAPQPGERILDLGCGDGVLTKRLVDLGCHVVAVDSSAAQIEAAKKLGLDAHVMDAEALPFRDEFDAVFSNAVLHWIKQADPMIAAAAPPVVPFPHDFQANSIVIDTGARKLYYVLADSRAYAYSIGVGREGFGWTGTETISRKQAWPDWFPPAEMRERDPRLPVRMTGGIQNPLGATALYLGNTLYRIHGTNDPKSIGRAESSGCFRMLNAEVMHLASLADIGTPVSVVAGLPARPQVSRAPEPPVAAGDQARPASAPATPATGSGPAAEPLPDYRSLRDYALQRR